MDGELPSPMSTAKAEYCLRRIKGTLQIRGIKLKDIGCSLTLRWRESARFTRPRFTSTHICAGNGSNDTDDGDDVDNGV